jgi:diguanylate cyclase (GGDEF)-like protein
MQQPMNHTKDIVKMALIKGVVSILLLVVYVIFATAKGYQGDIQLGAFLIAAPIISLMLTWYFKDSAKHLETSFYIRRLLGLGIVLIAANTIEDPNPDFKIRLLFLYPFLYFIYINEFQEIRPFSFGVFVVIGLGGIFLIPSDTSNHAGMLLLMLFATAFGYDTIRLRVSNNNLYKELHENTQHTIHSLSHFDTLTGLPNQFSLNKLADSLVLKRDWRKRSVGVIAVGLNNFKAINEAFGHSRGDNILFETAQRLKSTLGENDILTRFNGDQFHIYVLDWASDKSLKATANIIAQLISEPFKIEDQPIKLTAGIGIVKKSKANESIQELQRLAEAAMNEAKANPQNDAVFYNERILVNAQNRFLLESELLLAIEDFEQFSVHYQPIMATQSGKIVGAEALLRWSNPKFGAVSPEKFIPLAEKSGLILPLGAWILDQAVNALATLDEEGIQIENIGINLSASQLLDDNLLDRIEGCFINHPNVSRQQINIELTESTLMINPEEAEATLKELSARGLTLSIDDYGVAYSSLSYLKKLPANILKIDRSFITDLTTNRGDLAIVSSTIVLAHKLGLTVVAEGVETKQQLEVLRSLGCDKVQGFLLAQPMPIDSLKQYISSVNK